MRRFIEPLIRWVWPLQMETEDFALGEDERREMITDVVVDKFSHLDVDDVKWVSNWVLTLAEASDDQLLRVWQGVHCGG